MVSEDAREGGRREKRKQATYVVKAVDTQVDSGHQRTPVFVRQHMTE